MKKDRTEHRSPSPHEERCWGEALSFIPQRPPFVMVDRIVSNTDTVTITGFVIHPDNIFVENGIFREPGLVENIAQSAAARAGYIAKTEGQPVRIGFIGSIKNLRVMDLPKINDEIITEITIENQIFDVSIIRGRITCKNEMIAECEMKIFITNQ
ncbi:MAG: 3-hydroxyacyl-ACP dehydratase [Ferruginibacter sp.]